MIHGRRFGLHRSDQARDREVIAETLFGFSIEAFGASAAGGHLRGSEDLHAGRIDLDLLLAVVQAARDQNLVQ